MFKIAKNTRNAARERDEFALELVRKGFDSEEAPIINCTDNSPCRCDGCPYCRAMYFDALVAAISRSELGNCRWRLVGPWAEQELFVKATLTADLESELSKTNAPNLLIASSVPVYMPQLSVWSIRRYALLPRFLDPELNPPIIPHRGSAFYERSCTLEYGLRALLPRRWPESTLLAPQEHEVGAAGAGKYWKHEDTTLGFWFDVTTHAFNARVGEFLHFRGLRRITNSQGMPVAVEATSPIWNKLDTRKLRIADRFPAMLKARL